MYDAKHEFEKKEHNHWKEYIFDLDRIKYSIPPVDQKGELKIKVKSTGIPVEEPMITIKDRGSDS